VYALEDISYISNRFYLEWSSVTKSVRQGGTTSKLQGTNSTETHIWRRENVCKTPGCLKAHKQAKISSNDSDYGRTFIQHDGYRLKCRRARRTQSSVTFHAIYC